MALVEYRDATDKVTTIPVDSDHPLPTMDRSTVFYKAISAVVVAPGTGYIVGDAIYLAADPARLQPTVLVVSHIKVLSAVVVDGGTSGTPGPVTITGTTGTGTPFQATGTINAEGALEGALVVTVAGDYTVNPTDLTAEPVTGGSLSGCTVALTTGVKNVTVNAAGQYVVEPTNPAAQVSTTGAAGVEATFTVSYAVQDQIADIIALLTQIVTNTTPA